MKLKNLQPRAILRRIMRDAWSRVKKWATSLSEALRQAWAEYKNLAIMLYVLDGTKLPFVKYADS